MIKYPASFEYAMEYVFKNEGKYVNHKNDSGGETNFGITKIFLKDSFDNFPELQDVLKKPFEKVEIKNLTKEEAKALYFYNIYRKNGLEEIINQSIKIKIFDMIVNIGEFYAIKVAQKAINNCGKIRLLEDGRLGFLTISALNAIDINKLKVALENELIDYYSMLVDKNPENKVFYKGWIKRARSWPND